jgi:hypothetical protein
MIAYRYTDLSPDEIRKCPIQAISELRLALHGNHSVVKQNCFHLKIAKAGEFSTVFVYSRRSVYPDLTGEKPRFTV